MAVYRNDQVDFSFGAEIGAGGYLAPVKATADSSGDLATTTDTVSLPGARTIGAVSTTNAVVGEYVQLLELLVLAQAQTKPSLVNMFRLELLAQTVQKSDRLSLL